jgi:hypothetical protein
MIDITTFENDIYASLFLTLYFAASLVYVLALPVIDDEDIPMI